MGHSNVVVTMMEEQQRLSKKVRAVRNEDGEGLGRALRGESGQS